MCGQKAAGNRNEHLLFECTDDRVVEALDKEGNGGSSGEEGEQVGEARANGGSNHGALGAGQQFLHW